MSENEISAIVLSASIQLHTDLGPGLFESVYERALAGLLEDRRLTVRRQASIPFEYAGHVYTDGFRADLVVNERVIVEVKSVDALNGLHRKQLRTYLRLTGLRLGLLVNFNGQRLMDGWIRVVNGM